MLKLLLPFLLSFAFAQNIGSVAPNFRLMTSTGEVVTLSDYAGTPVVVNIWATWCPPCREELPVFQRAYNELNAANPTVAMLLVNNSENPDRASDYLRAEGITLTAAQDARRAERALYLETHPGNSLDTTAEVVRRYHVRGMPTTYFIDANGIIQAIKYGQVTERDLSNNLTLIGVDWRPW